MEKSFSMNMGNSNRMTDTGPADVGHEIHAKMEEAAEHALTIINGAFKFAADAENEQESKPGSAASLPGSSAGSIRFKRALNKMKEKCDGCGV